MNVKELTARQGKVDITLKIDEKQEPRSFAKFGKEGRVANAIGSDATGKIKITLWNEQVDQINAGDTIKITNGYVGEWQGELQLSTGKFGTLEVVDKNPNAPAKKKEPEEDPNADYKDMESDVDEENVE